MNLALKTNHRSKASILVRMLEAMNESDLEDLIDKLFNLQILILLNCYK